MRTFAAAERSLTWRRTCLCDRDALSDLALHFLNKMKIMVVKEIEREDIEFICKVRLLSVGGSPPTCSRG